MKKLKNISTILVIAGIVLLAKPARANILTIREEQYELQVLQEKLCQAEAKEDKAVTARKSIAKATKTQKKVVKTLLKADREKQKAERESIDAKKVAEQYDAYYSDTSHANGSAQINVD